MLNIRVVLLDRVKFIFYILQFVIFLLVKIEGRRCGMKLKLHRNSCGDVHRRVAPEY